MNPRRSPVWSCLFCFSLIFQSCGGSTGYLVQKIESKVPIYRLDMKGVSGQEPPFRFEGVVAAEPLTLTYFLFHEGRKTQQYAAEWNQDRWRNFPMNEESHPELFAARNALDELQKYSGCIGETFADFISSINGRAVFAGKEFHSKYPKGYWSGCKIEGAQKFSIVRVFSYSGTTESKTSPLDKGVHCALEMFLYESGDRILFIEGFGNSISYIIGMSSQFRYQDNNVIVPFLLWQPNINEAIVADLRSVLPRAKIAPPRANR